MKRIISAVLFVFAAEMAEATEFSDLKTAQLYAPLPVIPQGTSYIGKPPYVKKSSFVLWGTSSKASYPVVPSIRFDAYDDKGVPAEEKCPSLSSPPVQGKIFPKHLGTDYAAPADTPVFAIADGIIRRVNTFSTKLVNGKPKIVGDYYVVVESGSTDQWTTVYGHLNKPPSYPLFGIGNTNLTIAIKKGDQIGTLFNFNEDGDVPHLHMGIRKGRYDGTGSANQGYVCEVDKKTLKLDAVYRSNKYNFVSPESYRYYTPYY
jgi:hypothetical protein